MFSSNPLAEANGNKEKKKKTEMNVVMEDFYCRRF
jgi:hypothetical protein